MTLEEKSREDQVSRIHAFAIIVCKKFHGKYFRLVMQGYIGIPKSYHYCG